MGFWSAAGPALMQGGFSVGGNAFSAAESFKNRKYTAKREDSEIQRRVADLKMAGLNPALAIDGIGSASSQAPAQPQVHDPDVGSNLIQGKLARAQIDLMGAQSAAAAAAAKKSLGDVLSPGVADEVARSAAGHSTASAAAATQSADNMRAQLDEIAAHVKEIEASAREKNINAQTAEVLLQYKVKIDQLEAQLKGLQVPQERAKADVAKKVGETVKGYDDTRSIAEKAGSWLGGKAADLKESIENMLNNRPTYEQWKRKHGKK